MTNETPMALDAACVLPHRAPMLLIDRLVSYGEESVTAAATITAENLFVRDGALPAYVLLEYMAQTMGLWVCWQAKKANLPPPVGFLLGTRHLDLSVTTVAVGTELELRAQRIYVSDDGLAQFDCQTLRDGRVIARARLNAFQPKSLENFS